ncbi:unnamed protein product [Triticum turgidum subsp. durum]|uniref:Uncharacterized protein n=1 Tax=Triticum turgidum subsp. durum TaxID=4567 RepID=A0A9R1QW80_TRITD|nr:unnamed protein product [Triticum turgidum subsp. durum]
MARLATLAVLLLSLLAVASCRVLETISDDQGSSNSVLLTQDDQAEAAVAEVTLPALPTTAVAVDEGMLRLPSHRRPCHLHRHLWWTRHHGLSHHRGAFSGSGEARVHPAVDVVVPTELAREEQQEPSVPELEAVAEPDPDSRPDTDAAEKLFHGDEEEAANAWKVEMLRRFRHGIRFHPRHHLHHQHEQDGEEHDDHEQDKDEGTSMNLFGRFHHRHHLRHHHEQDAEEEDGHQQNKDEGPKMKLFRRFHHHHAHDSDNEVDEVEELARKLSQAIMRRSFSHGSRRYQHHHHGAEGGVKKWFKGLVNRF